MMGNPRMDYETLQALIEVYRVRASTDLLSILLDEAEGPQGRAAVLELLRSLPPETLSHDHFVPVRRQACQFCLNAADFELAERLARSSEQPEDRAMRARALHGLGREQEAVSLYRQAIAQDPAMRNRELERILGIRPGANSSSPPAKIISLTTYSSRRDNKIEQERRDAPLDTFLEDLDDAAVTFGDVAGLDDIEQKIRRRIVLPYLKPSLFERYRQKPGGSILLYGPPGCGKTLIARAIAGESDARFLSVSPEEILDKYAGEAEKRLRVFFDEARSDPPAILFFDDFDVLAFKRATSLTRPLRPLFPHFCLRSMERCETIAAFYSLPRRIPPGCSIRLFSGPGAFSTRCLCPRQASKQGRRSSAIRSRTFRATKGSLSIASRARRPAFPAQTFAPLRIG